MSQPLRILQVVTTMNRGGLETMIMNHYRHIDRTKIQFDFLTHRDEEGAYEDEIKQLGGRVYRVRRANPFDLIYQNQLKDFFASHPYKVVHSHIDCMSSLPLAAAEKAGVAMRIAHSHSKRQDKNLRYPIKLLCRRNIKKHATHLLACSKDAGAWMFGTDKFNVFCNAIQLEKFKFDPASRIEMRDKLGIEDNEICLGYVGRLEHQKNPCYLVDILNACLENNVNARMVCVGDGNLKNSVIAKAKSYEIASRIMFIPNTPNAGLFYNAMDVFLMPSLCEGLGMVVVEAQANGLPCIVSHGVPRDVSLTESVIWPTGNYVLENWVDAVEIAAYKRRNFNNYNKLENSLYNVRNNIASLESFYLQAKVM